MSVDSILASMEGWERIANIMAHKRKLLVHPQNYKAIVDGVKTYYPDGRLQSHIFMMGMGGVEIVIDPFIPLVSTVKKRIIFTGKQRRENRGKWYVKEYKTVQVPVLGWWLTKDHGIKPYGG